MKDKKRELETDRNFKIEEREPETETEVMWFFLKEQFALQGKVLDARSEKEKKSMTGLN